MSEILLQTIVEKLETLEKSQQELKSKIDAVPEYSKEFKDLQERLRMTQMDIKSMPQQISIPLSDIVSLKETITKLKIELKEPLTQKVKHIHYTSKPLLACIVLVMIIVGLCVWISKLYDRQNEIGQSKPVQALRSNDNFAEEKIKSNKYKATGKIGRDSLKLKGWKNRIDR